MKLTIDPATLRDAVTWTARALPARPATPILAGILLDASAEHLTLSAFDYEASARATAQADVTGPGRVLLPGRVLTEITKHLPDRPVQITAARSEAILTCGKAEFGLPVMPVEDYPTLPPIPESAGTVDATQLHHALSQVAIAAAIDDTVPMLTGVRMELDANAVTLVATDRYRLAVRELNWQAHNTTHQRTLLAPAHTLHALAKGLTGPATISLDDGTIAISTGTRTVTQRLLENEFPKWRNLLPEQDAITATARIPAHEFSDAVKRVALVRDRGTPVRLKFTAGQVLVHAGGGDNGRGAETVDAKLDGDPIEIAFAPRYLLDAITACDSQTAVTIALTEPVKPAVLAPADITGYRHLVMPIRQS